MKILFLVIIISFLINNICFTQVWNDDFNGIDSIWNESVEVVNSISINDLYNDGDSVLYIGGGFYHVNNDVSHGIASWDTDTISVYQQGVEWGGVYAICKYLDTLYIGGTFTSASGNPNTSYLAIWNGNNWQSAIIGKPGDYVRDFCIYHDTLFVAGHFSTIGGIPFDKIAAYNAGHWINVGSFGMWSRALAVFNDELYAGGYWGVRKYLGGTDWETFDIVPDGPVYELMTDSINSFLFVGGEFFHINGEHSFCIALWDGFYWKAMGWQSSTTVMPQSTAIYRGELYTGNGVKVVDDDYTFFIKKWNGETWDSIGGEFSSAILALEVFRDTLYIGGNFAFWGGDSPVPDKRNKGMVKLYMPDNGCDYLKPRINAWADTFYLNDGEVDVNLYNNNPYVDSWEWDFTSTSSVTIPPPSTERNPVVTFSEVGEYNVQVTVTDGECVKTANKTIYIELGNEIPQFEQIDMQIFPNPSSNDFTVKVTLPNYQNAEIKIAGLNGHLKSVIPVNGETTIIPTKGWKAGVYVCNLFVDGKLVKVEKVVFE